MKIIAHRALLEGPNSILENHPDQIEQAIFSGFSAEIDLRFIDGLWWLGHDKPQYQIEWGFIQYYAADLYLHAKDIFTLYELIKRDLEKKYHLNSEYVNPIEYFYHNEDDCALTSRGYIWSYPRDTILLTKRSIAVLPELIPNWLNLDKCFGVCTDYSFKYKELLDK